MTNHTFLRRAAETRLPIILSTGMANLQEVKSAVDVVMGVWSKETGVEAVDQLVVLHCTSLYPAPLETLNLTALTTMREQLGVRVGYSDHSEGTVAAVMAIALGAVALEKHLTYDRAASGPDHQASLDPSEFRRYVENVRQAEVACGDGVKAPSAAEIDTANVARKSIFARRDLRRGECIKADDLDFRRPGTGIGADRADALVGRVMAVDLRAGDILSWDDLE